MKEETKKMIQNVTNTTYSKVAEVAIKSAANAAFSVNAMTIGDYKSAAASAATAVVLAPISAATGVLLAGASVIIGSAVLTAATTGIAVDAVKSMTQKTETPKMATAQK